MCYGTDIDVHDDALVDGKLLLVSIISIEQFTQLYVRFAHVKLYVRFAHVQLYVRFAHVQHKPEVEHKLFHVQYDAPKVSYDDIGRHNPQPLSLKAAAPPPPSH